MKLILKKVKEPLIVLISFIIYIFNQKIYRPQVFSNSESNQYLVFILGIIPNFLGAIMTFLTCLFLFKLQNKKSLRKIIIISFLTTLILVIFMELERFINQNMKFDFFDILASILALIICLIFYKKEIEFYD
ncbi:hypothetical protein KO506_06860 [Polaribacter vadi]|uniref:hypothetical protein n=1 Tax=Polaribacter TaxID=52959 RepID=UPI001C09B1AC|nr:MULTISPECIES: hypothetical protein [Polaribacter]MBU3011116.1 hypothetical protein [Polaribacter vadi]MDO6740930.1 hypothetical protein [Polaribacter sp. 1_MG-2023]